MTGSSSLIAVFSSPFASYGVAGETTLSPGTWVYQASSECECCAASWWPAPPGIRSTIGQDTWPPNM